MSLLNMRDVTFLSKQAVDGYDQRGEDLKAPQLPGTMKMLHPAGGFEGPKTTKLEMSQYIKCGRR